MKLTAVVITKNEENKIESCLSHLHFVQEIVIVDNGSTDKTVSVAQKNGAKTYKFREADFSELRNYGREKSSGDWLLYIDADEKVDKKLSEEIKEAIISEEYVAYKIPRLNYYLGVRWPKIETFIRLIRKDALIKWEGKLHETPIVKGKAGLIQSHLIHYGHEDLYSMVEKTNVWSDIEAKLRLSNNHPPVKTWRLVRVMMTAFFYSYVKQGGWKAGIAGIVESIYQAFSMFITYAKLWELQNKTKT